MEPEHSNIPKPAARRTVSFDTRLIVFVLLLFIVATGGFIGGMQFQKGKHTSINTAATTRGQGFANGQMGGPGGQSMNGGFGIVSAVSATSITVTEQRAGTAKTYTISSSTTITKDSATIAATDIVVGDRVRVATSGSTATNATTITVNPNMGSQQGAPSATMQSTTTN